MTDCPDCGLPHPETNPYCFCKPSKGKHMTNFIGWTPPPGVAVVAPPVHPETVVSVIYSDAHVDEDEYLAHRLNWSAIGDGPGIVAYAVVSEYEPAPEPREFWLHVNGGVSLPSNRLPKDPKGWVLCREVLPAAREVVAWAVVGDDFATCFYERKWADNFFERNGGTVVRLSGVMP